MASSNPVMTDPVGDAQATKVQNHGQNVEQNTGLGASSAAQHNPSGDSVTNTSTSIKGSGVVQPGAGVDNSDSLLKNPRKQDGAAHGSSAGSLHATGQGHKADF